MAPADLSFEDIELRVKDAQLSVMGCVRDELPAGI